jgi:hypothetical protein
MHPTRKKLQMMPTNFILFSKFLITIFRSFWGYIIFCIAPVAVIYGLLGNTFTEVSGGEKRYRLQESSKRQGQERGSSTSKQQCSLP